MDVLGLGDSSVRDFSFRRFFGKRLFSIRLIGQRFFRTSRMADSFEADPLEKLEDLF